MQLSRYLLGFALLVLASCSPSKRIIRIAANNPGSLAGPCAQFYPSRILKDSTITRFIQGKVVPGPVQYINSECDSQLYEMALRNGATEAELREMRARLSQARKPCPPATQRVDTFYSDSYREQENTAEIEAMRQKMEAALQKAAEEVREANRRADKAEVQADNFRRQRNKLGWILGAMAAYFAVRIILRMYTRISLP